MAYLASAVTYQNVLHALEGWVNTNTDISGAGGGVGDVILGNKEMDIFGTSDLIGYSHSNAPNKIIRRHS